MAKSEFLKTAIEAVKKAEKVIMKYYSGDIKAELKSDQSPVTIADREAEKIIIKTIKEKFPEHGFFGEEFGRENKESEYFWAIDPIDGTINYMRQIPFFATQLALIKNEELILGVSNAPLMKELMYAEKGKGAYLNGKRVKVSSISKLSEACLAFSGLKWFEKHKKLKSFVSLQKVVRGARAFGYGDFFCYVLLAQGKIDIVVDAQTKIWDIGALTVIVREAGGKVTNINGGPVEIGTTSIIATNGKLHEEVLKFFL